MNVPQPRTARLMQRAAEYRVAGYSWDKVGDSLRVTGNAVRGWTKRHPSYWLQLLAAVRAEQVATGGDEALGVLRRLLRSDNEAIRRDAARQLRAECDAAAPSDAPTPDTDLHRIADYLEGLSHDQRQQLLERELARRAGSAADAADGANSSASA